MLKLMKKERREARMYKLRVYMDAIKDASATSEYQWAKEWARNANADNVFVSRRDWIGYLERCALAEVTNMLRIAA